jgi:hypothetical protein
MINPLLLHGQGKNKPAANPTYTRLANQLMGNFKSTTAKKSLTNAHGKLRKSVKRIPQF